MLHILSHFIKRFVTELAYVTFPTFT